MTVAAETRSQEDEKDHAADRAESPATLRGIVESALSSAAAAHTREETPDEPREAEPATPLRTIIIGAGVIVLLALLARLVF